MGSTETEKPGFDRVSSPLHEACTCIRGEEFSNSSPRTYGFIVLCPRSGRGGVVSGNGGPCGHSGHAQSLLVLMMMLWLLMVAAGHRGVGLDLQIPRSSSWTSSRVSRGCLPGAVYLDEDDDDDDDDDKIREEYSQCFKHGRPYKVLPVIPDTQQFLGRWSARLAATAARQAASTAGPDFHVAVVAQTQPASHVAVIAQTSMSLS